MVRRRLMLTVPCGSFCMNSNPRARSRQRRATDWPTSASTTWCSLLACMRSGTSRPKRFGPNPRPPAVGRTRRMRIRTSLFRRSNDWRWFGPTRSSVRAACPSSSLIRFLAGARGRFESTSPASTASGGEPSGRLSPSDGTSPIAMLFAATSSSLHKHGQARHRMFSHPLPNMMQFPQKSNPHRGQRTRFSGCVCRSQRAHVPGFASPIAAGRCLAAAPSLRRSAARPSVSAVCSSPGREHVGHRKYSVDQIQGGSCLHGRSAR